jgi:hypothetical protein
MLLQIRHLRTHCRHFSGPLVHDAFELRVGFHQRLEVGGFLCAQSARPLRDRPFIITAEASMIGPFRRGFYSSARPGGMRT